MTKPTTTIRTHIPAAPGWSVASVWYDDEGNLNEGGVCYDEILAWEVLYEEGDYERSVLEHSPGLRGQKWTSRSVEPLTVDGHPDDVSNVIWAIRSPGGKYTMAGCFRVDTEEDFLNECREHAKVSIPKPKAKAS